MTKEEAIKVFHSYAIWDLMDNFTTDELQEMINAIVSTPSLPSNLDEAAEKNFETMEVLEHENIFEETHNRIFKAGAEWMAEQGETREVEVKEDAGGYPYITKIELYDYDKDEPLFKPGKVIVQIRKIL